MASIMRTAFALLIAIVSLGLPAHGDQAAGANPAAKERVAALKQALAENQAALKHYTWTETTEISLKGEVKKRQQKTCRYGPDGKVQKTAVEGGEPQQAQQSEESRGGGRRRGGDAAKKAVVAHKVGEIKDYMTTYFRDAQFSEGNRPLFAFASYNCGPGNVAKARTEAGKRGLDPNKWFNNVEVVISQRIGTETTTYVRNIYKYYVAYRLTLDAQAEVEKAKQQIVAPKS